MPALNRIWTSEADTQCSPPNEEGQEEAACKPLHSNHREGRHFERRVGVRASDEQQQQQASI